MKSSRRQFLSTCAAAGVGGHAPVATGQAQNVDQQSWPSTFPALKQRVNEHSLSFLDSAATTLRPQSVIDALVEYYSTDNANPSPVHTLASRAAARLSGARQTLARFVNAPDSSEVIFVRGTTEDINLVAGTWGVTNLKADDEVVLTIAEHSSNLLPWTRAARQAGAKVRVVDVEDDGRPRLDQFKELLSKRTRVVAFTHVSKCAGLHQPRHDDELVQHGLLRLAAVPGLRIIGRRGPDRRVPVFTFVLEGLAPTAVARALDARGIAERAGLVHVVFRQCRATRRSGAERSTGSAASLRRGGRCAVAGGQCRVGDQPRDALEPARREVSPFRAVRLLAWELLHATGRAADGVGAALARSDGTEQRHQLPRASRKNLGYLPSVLMTAAIALVALGQPA